VFGLVLFGALYTYVANIEESLFLIIFLWFSSFLNISGSWQDKVIHCFSRSSASYTRWLLEDALGSKCQSHNNGLSWSRIGQKEMWKVGLFIKQLLLNQRLPIWFL